MVASPAADTFWNAPVTRRRFVKSLGLAGVSLALGQLGIPSAKAEATTGADTAVVFPQSVASGDPTVSGGILWTRIGRYAPAEPVYVQIAPGAGPTGGSAAAVEAFEAAMVTAGTIPAGGVSADDDHCIHFELTGQASDARVRYRFVHDGVASRIGVLRTLPAAGATVDQLRIAQATCQHYNLGYYTGYEALAQEAGEDGTGLDYLVHLGDLIYEFLIMEVGSKQRSLKSDDRTAYLALEPPLASELQPDGTYKYDGRKHRASKLESYRLIHRIYRDDPSYQKALERITLIATWDDHEVHDNWTGKGTGANSPIGTPSTAMSTRKFTGAVKAWTEWVPTRVQFPSAWTAGLTGGAVAYDQGNASNDGDWTMYRDFRMGGLAHLWMTDLQWFKDRQLKTDWATADGTPLDGKAILAHDEKPKDVALGPGYGGQVQNHLGPRQKAWLKEGIKAAATSVAWNVWGCSKPMAHNLGIALHPSVPASEADQVDETVNAGPSVSGGTWADYAVERDEVLTAIARTNTIVLAGDNHRPQAAILRERVGDPTALPAAVEFMAPALTSITSGLNDSSANPTDASQGLRVAGQHAVDDVELAPGRDPEDTQGELGSDANEAVAGAGPKTLDTRYAPRPFRGYSILTLTPDLARWEVHAVNTYSGTGGETGIPKAFFVPHGAPVIVDDLVDYAKRGVEHTMENPPAEVPEVPDLPEAPELPTDTGSVVPLLLSKVPPLP